MKSPEVIIDIRTNAAELARRPTETKKETTNTHLQAYADGYAKGLDDGVEIATKVGSRFKLCVYFNLACLSSACPTAFLLAQAGSSFVAGAFVQRPGTFFSGNFRISTKKTQ